MNKLLIAAAALMAGTAALAQTAQDAPAPAAQPAPAAPPAPMAHPAPIAHPMADKVMTRAEVVAMVREHFGKMDVNKDGSITQQEVMEGHMKMSGHMKDGPGEPHVMMREGPVGDPNAAFDRLDANKDGVISRDEFAKAREQRIERRMVLKEGKEEAAKDGKSPEKRAHRMHRMGGMGGARMIVMADTNKDGKITLAEAEALALQHFDQMDANHDGQVTPEERRAGRPMIIKKTIEQKKVES